MIPMPDRVRGPEAIQRFPREKGGEAQNKELYEYFRTREAEKNSLTETPSKSPE